MNSTMDPACPDLFPIWFGFYAPFGSRLIDIVRSVFPECELQQRMNKRRRDIITAANYIVALAGLDERARTPRICFRPEFNPRELFDTMRLCPCCGAREPEQFDCPCHTIVSQSMLHWVIVDEGV
jgi:hypothetical protein